MHLPPRYLLSILTCVFAFSPATRAADPPKAALAADPAKWATLVAKKLKEPTPQPSAIICIGSSHMANWKTLEADLAPLTIYNMGIGGSRMQHASELFVPKLVIPFKPRAVVLYEGSNDINAGVTPGEVLSQFQAVHQQIHESLPKTRLYVLGVVPSPGKRFERWEAIRSTNALLQSECAAHPWMRFIDTTSPLLGPNGKPNPDYFIPNDIHMTEAGYAIWKATIAPIIISAEAAFESSPQP